MDYKKVLETYRIERLERRKRKLENELKLKAFKQEQREEKKAKLLKKLDIKSKLEKNENVEGFKLDKKGRLIPTKKERKQKKVIQAIESFFTDFDDDLFEEVNVSRQDKKEIEIAVKNNSYFVGEPEERNIYNSDLKALYYNVNNLALDGENFYLLSRLAYEVLSRNKKNDGINSHFNTIRIAFRNIDGNFTSLVIDKDETKKNRNDFIEMLIEKLQQFLSKYAYGLTVVSISILTVKNGNNGGCNNSCKDLHPTQKFNTKFYIKNERKVKLLSPMSINNNCGIMCVLRALDIKGNEKKPDDIRKALNIELGVMLSCDDLINVLKYLDETKGLIIYDGYYKIMKIHKNENDDYIQILLFGEHYYLIEAVEQYCNDCNTYFMGKHTCNLTKKSFVNSKLKKDSVKCVEIKNPCDKKEMNYDDLICYDLETFQGRNIKHTPYACGWYNKEYKKDYGKGCMDRFVDEILSVEGKIITAYNTAKFDSYFLLDELIKRNVQITNFILADGKIMRLCFKGHNMTKENVVIDLCLFIMDSLENACKSFQTEFQKSEFDHSKIKTWNDVYKYRDEVEPYLKLDVLSLRELFISFNKRIYEIEQTNITNFITLSNCAYELWSSPKYMKALQESKSYIELFDNTDKYYFTKKALYGGRTYPMKRQFKSGHYDDIINGTMSYEELKISNDFIFNADCTSLYPTAMKLYKYPVGASRWSENPKEEFENGKMGFYEIQFVCPKDIRFAYLPQKKEKGGIEWSLNDGCGVYSNVDIQCALECGYKINFINKCLVWDKTVDNLFTDYIDTWYNKKEEADRNKDKVMKAISKLFLNGLYGKMCQRVITNNKKICNDMGDVYDFILENDINDWYFCDNKIILKGQSKECFKADKIKKPNYLGAFILSYSRLHMFKFIKAIDPTLKTCMFTYTDTDSLHITGDAYKKLVELGLLKDKKNSQLGYLCSDIDDEGLIIKETCLAPKCYQYEWINNKGEIFVGDKSKMKCKGIPKKCLKPIFYDDEYDEDFDHTKKIKFWSMKKIHTTVSSKQEQRGLTYFSVINNTQKRTFNKSQWCGMELKDNDEFYPKGYNNNLIY